ncbi:MAG: hypothetical protein AAB250_17920 [Bdellovibrionota bacterium]
MSTNLIRSVIVALLVVFCPKVQAERSEGGRIEVPMSAPKFGPKMSALMAKAQQGNATAQYQLAQIYDKGNQWVKKDPGQAIAWYEEAAINGHAGAAKLLGTH